MKSIAKLIASFFIPGGPLLGVFAYIFKPARLVIWLPLVFLAASVVFAGFAVKNYVRKAEANNVLVAAQGQQIKGLTGEVELQRQSVITATKNIQTYTRAVQVYAAKQEVYQQQIGVLRTKLAPTLILQKAHTDVKGATGDLNRNYADMLSMFDGATADAAVASDPGARDSSQTTTTTTRTRQDTTGPVASPPKRDTGP